MNTRFGTEIDLKQSMYEKLRAKITASIIEPPDNAELAPLISEIMSAINQYIESKAVEIEKAQTHHEKDEEWERNCNAGLREAAQILRSK